MSKQVQLMAWGTLLGFGISGLVLYYYFISQDVTEVFTAGRYIHIQLAVGLTYGLIAGVFANYFTKLPPLKKDCERYTSMIKSLNLNNFSILFLSLCAGIGEELFFRVALQPHFGIWFTSIFFVAIHGYLNPRRPVFFYGLMMTVIIAGMGWIYEEYGFWSTASAHFMVDFYLFHQIYKMNENT